MPPFPLPAKFPVLDGREATQDSVAGIVVRKVHIVSRIQVKVRTRRWDVRVVARMGMAVGLGSCWETGVPGCGQVRVYDEGHGECLWVGD